MAQKSLSIKRSLEIKVNKLKLKSKSIKKMLSSSIAVKAAGYGRQHWAGMLI